MESPKIQRVFWALSEGAAATALLAAGGEDALTALQTASIAAAFPLIFLLILMVYSLLRAFQMDEELLAMRRKGNDRELMHHQKAHNPVKSTDSIMNGHTSGPGKDMDTEIHVDGQMESKGDEMKVYAPSLSV